jgi:hypothetical protein
MAATLNTELVIRQGKGSRLFARPVGGGWASTGGTAALDGQREFAV